MFGCCVAGRLLQTNLVQVDETHAYFELPNASTINHLCVFLLGTIPFPDGFGASIHLFWPGKGFQLLGMLSNDKPSAIFRLRGTYSASGASAAQNRFSSYSSEPNESQDIIAILGLSIEPLPQIQYQLTSLADSNGPLALAKPDSMKDPTVLAERIVKHLLNYLSSFLGNCSSAEVMVPMDLIARWYESFLAKIKAGGTGFLERDGQ